MNRREFVTYLAALGITTQLPSLVEAAQPTSYPGYATDLNSIIRASFPEIRRDMLASSGWATDEMRSLVRQNRVSVARLGPLCEIGGQLYEIEELNIPMVWPVEDEQRNTTENQRVNLVKQLISNLLDAHDDLLIRRMEGRHLIVSENYRYQIGDTYAIPGEDGLVAGYIIRLFTAFVMTPQEVFDGTRS